MTSRPCVADSAGYTDEPRARKWDFLRESRSRILEEDQKPPEPMSGSKAAPPALLRPDVTIGNRCNTNIGAGIGECPLLVRLSDATDGCFS
jgi:hypothetical protein